MTDKDRRDRSGHNPSGSHPGTGALSFLPSIFGRRPAPAPAVTSRISTSVTEGNTRKSIDHDAVDPLPTSSKDKGVNLGIPEIPPPRRAPSPTPFDLEGALQVMDPKNKESTEVMSQMVKATAVYLANLLITSEDVFVETSRHDAALTEDQLKTLYLRAYNLASPSSDSTLRIAAIRLLAALFATSPPPKDHSKTDQRMELITTRSLYKIITTPSSDNSTTLEQTNVIVGALKALTKNGAEVEGMSGLVGWLVKALSQITDEWIKYCSVKDDHSNDWTERSKVSLIHLCGTVLTPQPQPFAPIKPANAAEVASAIIELLHAIIESQIALFGPADITRVVQPMLDMLWLGIAATPIAEVKAAFPIVPGSTGRRGSPASSGINTPALSASLGLMLDASRSTSLNRARELSSAVASPSLTPLRTVPPPFHRAATVAGSPTTSPTSALRSPSPDRSRHDLSPRWSRCFEPMCAFLETLINETPVPDDLFNRIVAVVCLVYGQDDSDTIPEEAWEAGQKVMGAALGPNGGRRGELAVRNILEGNAATISNNRSLKMPEEDRRTTRGAVM
jgi:hypothetical protein